MKINIKLMSWYIEMPLMELSSSQTKSIENVFIISIYQHNVSGKFILSVVLSAHTIIE